MRQLDRPQVDDLVVFENVARGRPDPATSTLLALVPAVSSAYEAYTRSLPPLIPTPIHLTAAQADTLRSNYRLTYSGSLKWLRDKIMSRAPRGRCPYCDSASVATLDHYLPKSTYPEFAILSVNLIPACFRCNNARNDVLKAANGARLWHAYLDMTPVQPIMFATLVLDGPSLGVSFKIDLPEGVDHGMVDQVRFTFEALKLNDFFGLEATNYLFSIAAAASRQWRAGGDAAVHEYFKRHAADVELRQGRNSWLGALAAALAVVTDFSHPAYSSLVRSELDTDLMVTR